MRIWTSRTNPLPARHAGIRQGLWCLFALMLIFLAAPMAHAQAPTPIAGRSLTLDTDSRLERVDPGIDVLLDRSGALDIAQLEALADDAFRPLDRVKPYVLGNAALWMRFDASITNPAVRWRLVIPMPTLDEATLYYRNAAGQWVIQRAGDHLPRSAWAQRARYPVFDLANSTSQNVRYYLKVSQMRMPYSSPPQILSDAEYIESRQNEQMLLGFYFGFVCVLVGLALFNAASCKDAAFAIFALQALLFACAQAVLSGLAGLYVWPQTPELNDSANVMFNLCAAAASLWFARAVCTPMRYSLFFDRLMQALIVLLPLVGIADVWLSTRASFIALNLVVFLALIALLVGIGVGLIERDRDTRWVALGFSPLLISALLLLARNLGMMSAGFETDYGRILAAIIGSPILFYGLWRRASQSRDLTARATSLRNADPLTGLHVTKVLLGKLRKSLATGERYHLPFALLVINLANLASLQKHHGREAADRAMVMAASRIRGIAHATDTVARVGDAQFALLLEGPLDADSANDVATRILASGLRPSNQLPDAEPLQFHIAVGHMGRNAMVSGGRAEARLSDMLQTVLAMNDGSGKAIRLVRF